MMANLSNTFTFIWHLIDIRWIYVTLAWGLDSLTAWQVVGVSKMYKRWLTLAISYTIYTLWKWNIFTFSSTMKWKSQFLNLWTTNDDCVRSLSHWFFFASLDQPLDRYQAMFSYAQSGNSAILWSGSIKTKMYEWKLALTIY